MFILSVPDALPIWRQAGRGSSLTWLACSRSATAVSGVLMRVRKWARESGDLSLAAPRQQIRRVLRVTGLIDVFSVYPSAEQALSGETRAGVPSARALEPRRPADDARRGTRVRRVGRGR